MTFPDRTYDSVCEYAKDYFAHCADIAAHVPKKALAEAVEILTAAYRGGKSVYVCGNGGSASISDHFTCDHLKGTRTDTGLLPHVVSLACNNAVITAIANDISYDEVFVYQLQSLAHPGDVLVTISSSGDSENVVRALKWAVENDLETIAMTGFDGGRSAGLARVNLHVPGDNYGVIEDVHQGLMHVLSQYIRQAHMDEAVVKGRKF